MYIYVENAVCGQNAGKRRRAVYQHTVHTKHSGLRRSCRMCITARMCRSIEVRQEAVGPCGLSSQLPRRHDFFAEK